MKNSIHFWPYLAHFFLEWEMLQTKAVKKIKTHFLFNSPFLKSCCLWANAEKYCRNGQAADDNTVHAHCKLDTNTHSEYVTLVVEASWIMMAHVQKPDFVFRRGRQFSQLLAAKVYASAPIVGSNAGYTMFWGSVNDTGYPLHSPVSPSIPLPCVTVCHHISTGLY
jgi:hypothetical protein